MSNNLSNPGPEPVPAVVGPQSAAVTTIPVTPRTHVEVSRRGGLTRLALVSVNAGARVATDLTPQAVDALVAALASAVPVAYEPATGGER